MFRYIYFYAKNYTDLVNTMQHHLVSNNVRTGNCLPCILVPGRHCQFAYIDHEEMEERLIF